MEENRLEKWTRTQYLSSEMLKNLPRRQWPVATEKNFWLDSLEKFGSEVIQVRVPGSVFRVALDLLGKKF